MPVSADANLLSRLAGEARLHHTPCGSGRMAWRVYRGYYFLKIFIGLSKYMFYFS